MDQCAKKGVCAKSQTIVPSARQSEVAVNGGVYSDLKS